MLGGEAQRHFAEGGEVALLEKILRRRGRAVAEIDLAPGESLAELPSGKIHQRDLVGEIQHAVRHGLAHLDAGDLRDGLGATFDVLDVERGEHVEARVEEFEHVLIALRVA